MKHSLITSFHVVFLADSLPITSQNSWVNYEISILWVPELQTDLKIDFPISVLVHLLDDVAELLIGVLNSKILHGRTQLRIANRTAFIWTQKQFLTYFWDTDCTNLCRTVWTPAGTLPVLLRCTLPVFLDEWWTFGYWMALSLLMMMDLNLAMVDRIHWMWLLVWPLMTAVDCCWWILRWKIIVLTPSQKTVSKSICVTRKSPNWHFSNWSISTERADV